MYNPEFVKHAEMVNYLSTKHKGELDWLTFDYVVTELYTPSGQLIQQLTPKLLMNFKTAF